MQTETTEEEDPEEVVGWILCANSAQLGGIHPALRAPVLHLLMLRYWGQMQRGVRAALKSLPRIGGVG